MDWPDRIEGISPTPPTWRVAERRRERQEDERERRPKHDEEPLEDDDTGEGGLIDVRA